MKTIKCILLTAMLSMAAIASVNAQNAQDFENSPYFVVYPIYLTDHFQPVVEFVDSFLVADGMELIVNENGIIFPCTVGGRTGIEFNNAAGYYKLMNVFLDLYNAEGSNLEAKCEETSIALEKFTSISFTEVDLLNGTGGVSYWEPHPTHPTIKVRKSISFSFVDDEPFVISFVAKTEKPNSVAAVTNAGKGISYSDGTLNIFSDEIIGRVTIYNVSGAVVKTFATTDNFFSANLNLPAGVYILKYGNDIVKIIVK